MSVVSASSTTTLTSTHGVTVGSTVVPVPSGCRNTGALSAPVALFTVIWIVTVVDSVPFDTVKSNACAPRSSASGVHRNSPAPSGCSVICAVRATSLRSAL